MTLIVYRKLAIFALLVLMALTPVSSQQKISVVPDGETRRLLLEMRGHRSTRQLAALFQFGDNKIADLIGALRDPNQEVKLDAQIVIRYLGNEDGMIAWTRKYESDQEGPMTAPIPIPLRDLDYEFIRSLYLRDKVLPEALMEAYLFALALDGSPRAAQLLSDVISNAKKSGFKLQESRYLKVRATNIAADADLAAAVLDQATFLNPTDREDTTARLIAYTHARDKALVEIYVNRGPLAEEWYHVVVKRGEQGWRFFSITQVAVS
jgi:hypothetical protein